MYAHSQRDTIKERYVCLFSTHTLCAWHTRLLLKRLIIWEHGQGHKPKHILFMMHCGPPSSGAGAATVQPQNTHSFQHSTSLPEQQKTPPVPHLSNVSQCRVLPHCDIQSRRCIPGRTPPPMHEQGGMFAAPLPVHAEYIHTTTCAGSARRGIRLSVLILL